MTKKRTEASTKAELINAQMARNEAQIAETDGVTGPDDNATQIVEKEGIEAPVEQPHPVKLVLQKDGIGGHGPVRGDEE